MKSNAIGPARFGDVPPATLAIPPVAATAVLWLSARQLIQTFAALCSFLLLLMAWGSFVHWQRGSKDRLPMFAMVAAAYWLAFGVPLFWGERTIFLYGFKGISVSEESVSTAIFMALVGVMALWLGLRVAVSGWRPAPLPDIVERPESWAYVRAVAVLGAILAAIPSARFWLGADARQVMAILIVFVPNVAFVLLMNRYLARQATASDIVVLLVSAGSQIIGGLASGWLGPLVATVVMSSGLIVLKFGRIPWKLLAIASVLLLFLQVGKTEFRTFYWQEQNESSLTERAQFWLERSMSMWGGAFGSEDSDRATALAANSFERVNLLSQVAHVLDITPADVPFQRGQTYAFVAVTLVPRFLWPDKPSVNDANRFYQTAYGLTAERQLESVSIAIGVLGEAFINFGWPGVIGMMTAIGLLLGVFERTFGSGRSSALFLAIGLAMLQGLVAVESQLSQYAGGLVQQAGLSFMVFLPIVLRPRIRSTAAGAWLLTVDRPTRL
jgi:hypothetical protein